MKGFLVGIITLLTLTHFDATTAAKEGPVRLPDCPLDDDPEFPTHLKYPGDCTKFYKCLHGYGYPMSCPAGLHWNDVAKLCDWPSLANCEVTKNLRDDVVEFTNVMAKDKPIKHEDCPEIDDPENPKHLPHPTDCTKFYKCSYGYAYLMNCPIGEHFGVKIDRCDWPNIAQCDPNWNEGSTTKGTTHKPTEPTTESTSTETTEIETTEETTKSSTTENTSESPITTSEPIPEGIDCSKVPHGTLYPHPESCKKFVHCSHGEGFVKYCPNILEFSSELLVCTWPEEANCVVTPRP